MDYLEPHPELYNVPFKIERFNGMPYRLLGKSGLKVSNIGLGTWKIGYPETGDGSRVNEKDALALLDRATELGVTFWDTANRYNNASGNAERVIGTWLKKNPGQRRDVVLATKLAGGMDGLTPNHCGLSRVNIFNAVQASMERLRTQYIDLLYFHAFDSSTPVEESLTAIEDLVKKDYIRYFAVSNFSVDQLKEYQQVNQKLSVRSRMVAVQNQFDLLGGEPVQYAGARKYARDAGISYIAWSPLARGLLSERYLDVSKTGPGDRLFDEGAIEKDADHTKMQKLHQLVRIARQWNLSISQLALAYMLTLPGMGPVIPSSSTIAQLESNAAAGKIELTTEQQAEIASLFSEVLN